MRCAAHVIGGLALTLTRLHAKTNEVSVTSLLLLQVDKKLS